MRLADTTVGLAVSQWSAVVGATAGLVYLVGNALLSLRLFTQYGLAPTAVLSALPEGFNLQVGARVVIPAVLIAIPVRKRFADWCVEMKPYVLGVVFVVAAVVFGTIGPIVTRFSRRHSILPNWEKIVVVSLLLLITFSVCAYVLYRIGNSDFIEAYRLSTIATLMVTGLAIAAAIVGLWSAVALPDSRACLSDGKYYSLDLLDQTDDTAYFAGVFYNQPPSTAPEKGSGFMLVLPRDQLTSIRVSNNPDALNTCVPRPPR